MGGQQNLTIFVFIVLVTNKPTGFSFFLNFFSKCYLTCLILKEPKKKNVPAAGGRGAQGGGGGGGGSVERGSSQPAKEVVNLEGLEPWFARKNGILAKYTTSEKLSIVTSFLTGGEKGTIIIFFFFSEDHRSSWATLKPLSGGQIPNLRPRRST